MKTQILKPRGHTCPPPSQWLLILALALFIAFGFDTIQANQLNVELIHQLGLLLGGVEFNVDVDVNDQYAYVACTSVVHGLYILDISDRDNPPTIVSIIDNYEGGGFTDVMWVSGDYLLATVVGGTENSSGLVSYDISDPFHPEVLDYEFTEGVPWRIARHLMSTFYVMNATEIGGDETDVAIVSFLPNPVDLHITGYWRNGDDNYVADIYSDFIATGNNIFIVGSQGMHVLDISVNPAEPEKTNPNHQYLCGEWPDRFFSVAINTDNLNTLYIGSNIELILLDVTNFADITLKSDIWSVSSHYGGGGSAAYKMFYAFGHVFIANSQQGFIVINVIDIEYPFEAGYWYNGTSIFWGLAKERTIGHNDFFVVGDNTNFNRFRFDWNPPEETEPFFNYFDPGIFQWVSSFRVLRVDDIRSVFNNVPGLDIVYNDDGGFWIPALDLLFGENTFFNTEAYKVLAGEIGGVPSHWITTGPIMDPETEFHVVANRYNLMGYPFDHEVPIEIALGEYDDFIEVVYTDSGGVYIPNFDPPINTIGNMIPGEGYEIFLISDEDLEIVYTDGAGRTISSDGAIEIATADDAPSPTGIPFAVFVYMTDELWAMDPATVEVFDSDLLVGKSYVLDDQKLTIVITWGGDERFELQGFQEGNPILIRVKDPIGNELASLISGEFGDDYGVEKRADSSNYLPRFRTEPYATVTLDLNQGVLPSEFSVENAYPNPFNSTTTVPFELPKSGEVSYTLYNLLGQKVLEQSRQYNAGLNQLVIDIGKSDYGTSSGLYLLSVRYNRTTLSQKIILLK